MWRIHLSTVTNFGRKIVGNFLNDRELIFSQIGILIHGLSIVLHNKMAFMLSSQTLIRWWFTALKILNLNLSGQFQKHVCEKKRDVYLSYYLTTSPSIWLCKIHFNTQEVLSLMVRYAVLSCIKRLKENWKILSQGNQVSKLRIETGCKERQIVVTNIKIRGLFKPYPTFGREKYIYTPGGLQT
jgi:hypothetical protein